MSLRITTWNVNGIRNPFSYQPWREKRSFEAMFDILEADIVVLQETKIQKKDLTDEMVLVPGWDVHFSLPKHKKGYSGVAIYTRNSTCCPVRAEEGVTGILTAPNSETAYRDLPPERSIGGYPRPAQLSGLVDDAVLDAEGRCVVLEFPAFVLLGVYCPAMRDATRTEFRMAFLEALDARVRNLVAAGKQVVLTGDLNIIGAPEDTANLLEQLRKEDMTVDDFLSAPSRRLFNHLVHGGRVVGHRDEGREEPVLWDLCRLFHPDREGMFTCWDTKKNTRPANNGSRIDYILCTDAVKAWTREANIQEGLMGSDHCPVYAVLAATVDHRGPSTHMLDMMNPPGMFEDGVRQREWTAKDLLPLSAKLMPEFDRRRNIRDMFLSRARRTETTSTSEAEDGQTASPRESPSTSLIPGRTASSTQHTTPALSDAESALSLAGSALDSASQSQTPLAKLEPPSPRDAMSVTERAKLEMTAVSPSRSALGPQSQSQSQSQSKFQPQSQTLHAKRGPQITRGTSSSTKRAKLSKSTLQTQTSASQKTLTSFFQTKIPKPDVSAGEPSPKTNHPSSYVENPNQEGNETPSTSLAKFDSPKKMGNSEPSCDLGSGSGQRARSPDRVFDPIEAKESWSKLLTQRRAAPKCEHGEPCISLVTKKPGINCGRSFYICPRPLGPSGEKEKNTQWRCGTFIWSSDWTRSQ